MVEHIRKRSASGEELNARDMSDKFVTASSANFALGINTNVFDENCQQGALYYKMTRKLMGRDTTAWENVKMMVAFFLPTLNKVLQFPTFNLRAIDFFFNVIRQTRCLIASGLHLLIFPLVNPFLRACEAVRVYKRKNGRISEISEKMRSCSFYRFDVLNFFQNCEPTLL